MSEELLMKQIFISHIEEDKQITFEIAKGLEAAGFKTWCYERDFVLGAPYTLHIIEAIEQSQAVILVISQSSINSMQIKRELILAQEYGKLLIPILLNISVAEIDKNRSDLLEIIGTAETIAVSSEGTKEIVQRILVGLSALELEIKGEAQTRGRYRVFISYSHEESDLAQKIASIISTNGLIPMWDKDFLFGRGFQDMIKNFIAHAHVFLPIVTKISCERGWVHQEIGYAMAMNVPILPVTYGTIPGEMIRELHAVQISDNSQELKDRLSRMNIEKLIESYSDSSRSLYQCAELSEDRAILMAQYANDVLQLEPVLGFEAYGCVRQKGGLSSFHIPDKVVSNLIWVQRYGPLIQSQYHCRVQRDERLALERHAKVAGCRLIINPYLTFEKHGVTARLVRLKTLIDFLETMPNDRLQVAIDDKMQNESVTIVGDWFLAQAVSSSQGQGYQQTIFTRHAPSITGKIEQFDLEFAELLKEWNWTPESSRQSAIGKIKEIIMNTKEEKQVPRTEKTLILPNGAGITIGSERRTFGRMDFGFTVDSRNLICISRVHFSIFEENGVVYILDAGSTNGTKLNGREIGREGKQVLKNGDVIDVANSIRLIFKTS